ncbi:sensor histidine kinase [Nucisporomicrobium flavum]|uniref:sensor histidine kinase n=1 Tax=Nucisporomicrobium flavum TaxID=2785915 RepID=UPI0018F6E1A8|nr:sensor histidine kinase [Nucisporomicrobium flavum]
MHRLRPLRADGPIALALLAVGLSGTAPAGRNQGIDHIPAWAYGCVVAAALAMAFRRVHPTPALATTTAATGLYLLGGNPFGPVLLSLLVAVYTIGAHRPLRRAATAAGVVLALLVVCALIGLGVGLDAVMPQVAWVAGPLAIGVTVRVGREQVLQARRDEARRQADAERLRVAQEVHDVVGHGLAAITMQAEIALHLLDKEPARESPARDALTAISRTSRESLDELRATLGAVRRGDDDRAPAPGLARLDDVVARTRAVGVPVTVEVEGSLAGLPAAVDLAGYRIVQEALTNVLRHAGTASAEVRLRRDDEQLTVSVTDTGSSSPGFSSPGVSSAGSSSSGSSAAGFSGADGPAAGHGLAGMRERVGALGGSLSAGPGPDGGFQVTATIPVRR